jgi:hypothetical protein
VFYLQELENVYENTRQDLLVTQEALAKFQSSQQVLFYIFRFRLLTSCSSGTGSGSGSGSASVPRP